MEILPKDTGNYAKTVPFRKISTPGNEVKLQYFTQCGDPSLTFDGSFPGSYCNTHSGD